mgnify:CR=1 FL=1
MIRKLSLSAMAASMLVSVAAAEVNFDKGGFNIKEELAAINAPAPAAPQDKGIFDWLLGKKPAKGPAEWTVMVFVNGKNDLEPFALKDLNEMEMVGSNAKVNIVVEAGRIEGYDGSDGDWKGTRRFLMAKDKDTGKVSSAVLQDMGKVDMGDYRSLVDFGKWAKAAYPAKKYMLVVWNHGSGWTKSGIRPVTKGISYDEETGNHINTPQLGQALREIGKLDIYGSDACLMQMSEVVYEIKDSVDYIVGSEETEPGDGYTYNTMLAPLAAKPAMTAPEFAKVAVDAYSDHYKAQDTGSTQSYLKSAAIPKLLTLTNEFAYAVTQSGDKAAAKSARDGAVQFAIPENKDLYDFTRLLVAATTNAEVKAKGQALMTFITSELVMHNRTNNDPGGYWNGPVDYSPAKGIATYIPSGALGSGYADLQWAKYSNWDEFINWINQP